MSLYPEPLPLGSCARCGAEVYADDRKLRPNHFLCPTCDAHRCAVCGCPDAFDIHGEWLCDFCIDWRRWQEVEREAEYWSHAGWKDVFGGKE